MDERSRKAQLEVLTESARERVLRRAAEIEEARGTRVSDLRAAAAEAGISPASFDQAIAELEQEQAQDTVDPVAYPQRRYTLRSIWIALTTALVIALIAGAVVRMVAPVRIPAPVEAPTPSPAPAPRAP